MPPFWSKPLPPEEEPKVPELVAAPDQDPEMWGLFTWRMRSLLDAFRSFSPDPLTLEDIDCLGLVAEGHADLHVACGALKGGCGAQRLADIFT